MSLAANFTAILHYVEQLQNVDVAGLEPNQPGERPYKRYAGRYRDRLRATSP